MSNIIKSKYHTYRLVWAEPETVYFQLRTDGNRSDVTIGGDSAHQFDQGYYAIIDDGGSILSTFDDYDAARKVFDSAHDEYFLEPNEKEIK